MGKSTISDTLVNGADGYNQAQVFISYLGSKKFGNGGSRVQGIMTGDFSIGSGAAWNTPLNSTALESISATLNIGKDAFQAAANKLGYSVDLGSQIQLKSLNQTVNFWTGSERPQFTVELMFISLVRGFDVRDHVLNLFKAVMPNQGKAISVLGSNIDVLLNAPLGYNPLTGAGTFSVQLGTWFRARNQVMKSVNFTFSQEMVPLNGDAGFVNATKFAPLYAKGSITFEPYRDITYSDFAGYFIRTSNSTTTDEAVRRNNQSLIPR